MGIYEIARKIASGSKNELPGSSVNPNENDVMLIMTSHDDKHPVYEDLLWQGARPEQGSRASREGFKVIVLCDDEFQPSRHNFIDVRILKCPLVDISTKPVPPADLEMILKIADRVARHVSKGEKVLVTCYAGINRSGLVVAHALHRLTGWGGNKVVDYIRSKRPIALTNHLFVQMISSLPELSHSNTL